MSRPRIWPSTGSLRNLYWTDKGMKHIEMSRTDGSFRRILVWKKCSPGAIVVDPINGFVFASSLFDVERGLTP